MVTNIHLLGLLSQARSKLKRATLKSDLSSTEDDDYSNKRCTKMSTNANSNSCPRLNDYISGMHCKLIYKYIFLKILCNKLI